MGNAKRITKVFTIVLLFAMVVSIFSPITAKAAPKIKLSKTNIKIAQGDSATIKLNNASSKSVKWSSSNKSVATVNKGKIKGIAPGKATITAKYKNKSYKCKVTVKKFGLEYIDSEIIGETSDGYNIIKYTNNTEYNIGMVIKNGYDGTTKITCAKGGSVYTSSKSYDEQEIEINNISKYTAIPDDFIENYEISVDEISAHNMFKCYLNNSTSERITCRIFIIFYDNNGEIVETKDFKSIGIDQGEKTMRQYSVDENVAKADAFVNYVYYDFLYD